MQPAGSLEKTMTGFIELQVQLREPGEEQSNIVIALLGEFPFETFTTENDGVQAYTGIDGIDETEMQAACECIEPFIQGKPIIREIQKENWNALWEKEFFQPTTLPGGIHIRAPFHPSAPDVPYVITIAPKMSFGTGHHPTTQLMLQLMLAHAADFQQSRVLDMGSGTGILAIMAEKLGAESVLAIDHEDWAAENIVENAALNQCSRITAAHGNADSLEAGPQYRTVLANIHKQVLLADMAAYASTLLPGGILYISGIYAQDREEMNAHAAALGLSSTEFMTLENWCAVRYALS
ncbi:MAG: 50S ribosomal protein L11 methyltransferase [Bacteroidetes bacterium]|nr:50S ribosomal protein L11 methyltransferase [Bacteroidota bacterium]